jgi:acylglycerol lipase
MISATTETTVAGRGVTLAIRSHEPAAPRAALVLVHGLGDHAARYDEFCAVAAARGIATWAVDLRGHGRSDGQRGHAARFDDLLADVDTAVAHAAHRQPSLPLFILGQSMGGLVVLRWLQERPAPRGAIICSPWLRTAMPVARWKLALAPVLGTLLPRLPFPNGIDPGDLTRDASRVERYRNDPLVHGRITPALYAAVTGAMEQVQKDAYRLRLPLLFMLGGADPVVDTPTTVALTRRLAAANVTLHLLDGHLHELLNETDRDATASTIIDWLLARL